MAKKWQRYYEEREAVADAKWWGKESGEWYDLDDDHPIEEGAHGVYVVFYVEGDDVVAVDVGKGDLAARIPAHKQDDEILQYAKEYSLKVTWVVIPSDFSDGVERYLQCRLVPLVNRPRPIPIPLPFGEQQ